MDCRTHEEGKYVRFEDLVKSVQRLKDAASWLGLEVKDEYTSPLDPKRAFKAPQRLREEIKKRVDDQVGKMLLEMGYRY